jgi:gluconolactonase
MTATLDQLIDPAAQMTCVATGFQFTEGPVWSTAEDCLYFSDIPGDTRWRWSADRGAEVALRPAFKACGLTCDAGGNLIACEHVTSSVVRYRPDGRREVLAHHHRGVYLNSPNDIAVRSADGGIYFSDPDYGRWNDWIGIKRTRDRFRGLYRVPSEGGGEAELLVDEDEFDEPNGVCFSPDEQLLYVNDSPRAHIKVFDVNADGSLANGRILIQDVGVSLDGGDEEEHIRHQRLHNSGAVDGMKCDELGNVWCPGPGGVWVISPEGRQLGVIPTPEVAGNLTWGGPELRSLFICTSTTMHVVETLVAAAALPHHRAPRRVPA